MTQSREEYNRKRRERRRRQKFEKLAAEQGITLEEFLDRGRLSIEEPEPAVAVDEDMLNIANRRPLHERFSEYTVEELQEIKKEVCIAHGCPYLTRVSRVAKNNPSYSKSVMQVMCNYILVKEHSRGCMPDICEHYKDKNVKKISHNQNLFKG